MYLFLFAAREIKLNRLTMWKQLLNNVPVETHLPICGLRGEVVGWLILSLPKLMNFLMDGAYMLEQVAARKACVVGRRRSAARLISPHAW